MLSSAPSRPLRILTERLLITKIITGLGLVLLLVLGAWSASHSEADGTVSSAAISASSIPDAAPATAFTGDPEVLTSHTSVVIPPSAWADVLTLLAGAGGCLLGIFCTLLLIALLRYVVLRRTPPILGTTARTIAAFVAPAGPSHQPLTLTQLSISRT